MKKILVLLLLLSSTVYGEIYTWKDTRGTAFYTNSLYEIPARYRSRAKLLDVATGKTAPLTATPPGGPSGAGAPPGQQAPVPQQQPQQVPAQPPQAQAAPAGNAMATPPAVTPPFATAPAPANPQARRRNSHRWKSHGAEE